MRDRDRPLGLHAALHRRAERRRRDQRRRRELLAQRRHAFAGRAVDQQHGQADRALELVHVDREALGPRDVDLGDRDDDRGAKIAQLSEQLQLDRELGRVEHEADQVRPARGVAEVLDRHLLVLALRPHRRDPGEIDELELHAVDLHGRLDRLHGRPREVDRPLQAAGQVHQQRGLAGVRAPEEGDPARAQRSGIAHPATSGIGATRTRAASVRSSASR